MNNVHTPGGYDHNFILNGRSEKRFHHAATVYETETGIELKVHTSEPVFNFIPEIHLTAVFQVKMAFLLIKYRDLSRNSALSRFILLFQILFSNREKIYITVYPLSVR